MKNILLVTMVLIISAQAMKTGSCERFSVDGEKCEECVPHFHLYEGSCYVDILGCQSYALGNICERCENNYILVNNLCCDHNCMLKFMKRHESKTIRQTFSSNFEVLSQIIPFFNQNYLREGGSILVEIEVHQYLDVTRYVLLYEFHMGTFSMKRGVVDYKHDGKEIIVVDWSTINSKQQFLEFHKEEVTLENQTELKPLLAAAFKGVNSVTMAKKTIFTELTQYEIVVSDEEREVIIYKTLYLWKQKIVNLISEQKEMPSFVSSQITLEGTQEITAYMESHKNFVRVLNFVHSDPRFRQEIVKVKVVHQSRFMNEYRFDIVDSQGTMSYYLVEDLKKDKISIVNYDRHENKKPETNEIVDRAVDIIENEKDSEELPAEEEKQAETVVEIVEEAIEKIINEREKEEENCSDDKCKQKLTKENEKKEEEQIAIVSLFRQFNPDVEDFEVAKVWEEKFETFIEWTVAIKFEKNYIYFFVLEEIKTRALTFWGQTTAEKLKLPNHQAHLDKSHFKSALKVIYAQFPQTQGLTVVQSIARPFPESRVREVVLLRHETSTVRYVIIKDQSTERVLKEWTTVEENLPVLTQKTKEVIQLKDKVEVIVDEIISGNTHQTIAETVETTELPETVEIVPVEKEKKDKKDKVKKDEKPEPMTEEEKEEVEIFNIIRSSRDDTENFQILRSWATKISEEVEQRIYLTRIVTTTIIYRYHFVTVNLITREITYLRTESTDSITENSEGQIILPTKYGPVIKSDTTETEKAVTEIVQEMQEQEEEDEDEEQVYEELNAPSEILEQIQKSEKISGMRLMRMWKKNQFETYSEIILLMERDGVFSYAYLFFWYRSGDYTFEGVDERVQPLKNDNGKFKCPKRGERTDKKEGKQLLKEVLPEEENNRVQKVRKVIELAYPYVIRKSIRVRTQTQIIRYVIHERNGQNKLIEQKVIRLLPVKDESEKVIVDIIEEIVEDVIEDQKQEEKAEECCNGDEKDENPKNEKEDLAITALFREHNPEMKDFQIAKVWKNKNFETFVEWTVAVKNEEGKYIYFFANEDLKNDKFTFWGQKVLSKLKHPNRQKAVTEEEVSESLETIKQEFPEKNDCSVVMAKSRKFPEQRTRDIITLRYETQKIRYVILKDEKGNRVVREWKVLKKDLPQLTKEMKDRIKLEEEICVTVEKIIVDEEDISVIPITPVPVPVVIDVVELERVTEEKAIEIVEEDSQVITVTDSPSVGHKVEEVRSWSDSERKTIQTIRKFIKKTESNIEETDKVILTEENPISVISQKFCDNEDLLIVFDSETTATGYGFRVLLTDSDNYVYLGKRTIQKGNSAMSDEEIIEKLTKALGEFPAAEVTQVISTTYPKYEGKTPLQIIPSQIGEELRFVVLYESEEQTPAESKKGFLNRFILGKPVASDYQILEECRVEVEKEVKTVTTHKVTGVDSVKTNDIEKLKKEDEILVQVLDFVEKENDLQEFEEEEVTVIEYEDTVEYDITLEKKDEKGEVVEVAKEVVVHKKDTHENVIVQDKRVPVTKDKPKGENKPEEQSPEAPEKDETPLPKDEKAKDEAKPEKPEKKVKPEILTEEKKKDLPEPEAEALEKLTKEVREKHNLKEDEFEVITTIIEDGEETDHIQEILQNEEGTETYIVEAVINQETGVYVIQETKEIGKDVVEHLKPIKVEETIEIVEEKKKEVEISSEEVGKVLEKVAKEKKQKKELEDKPCCQQLRTEEKPDVSEEPEVVEEEEEEQKEPVVIKVQDVYAVIEKVLEEPNAQEEIPEAPVVQNPLTSSEALLFVQSMKPETEKATLQESKQNKFSSSSSVTLKLTSKTHEYNAIVTKNSDEKMELTYYNKQKVEGEDKTETVQEIVKEIEEKDTSEYKPIDPENVFYVKSVKILRSQQLKEFEREIDVNGEQDDIITNAVLTIRRNYPIVKDAGVIRILESFNTPNVKQYSIYFYVPGPSESYKVYAFSIEYNSQASEPIYKILSVTLVIESNKLVNKVLEKESSSQSSNEHINIAYGYEPIPLAEAQTNGQLKEILAEIESKYSALIEKQAITSIEFLELKNGKVNYVIKYSNVYFTVFYDQILMRIVLLNAVTSLNNQQYTPVSDIDNNQIYKAALQHLIGQHASELKDYKVISSGQISNETHDTFQIEIFSQGHKYRGVVSVVRESMVCFEMSWNEIVEVDLKHINFMELYVEQYHRLSGNELNSNTYFGMIDTYARNHNKMLAGAEILGVGYKPQNLGFNFKIFYKLASSEIISVEIYIETFTEKINQLALIHMDFTNSFVEIKPEGQEVEEILKVLANKANLNLDVESYVIQGIKAKDFLFGSLYSLQLEISGAIFEGLLYHDHTTQEANLLSWTALRNSQKCEIWEVQDERCQKCSQGYYLDLSDNQCYEETLGCERYEEKERCVKCVKEFFLVNNKCIKDCGALCLAISAP